jgi:hypothetical protein
VVLCGGCKWGEEQEREKERKVRDQFKQGLFRPSIIALLLLSLGTSVVVGEGAVDTARRLGKRGAAKLE